MHKKGTCLASVTKVCPERQPTTAVVQVPPSNQVSLANKRCLISEQMHCSMALRMC